MDKKTYYVRVAAGEIMDDPAAFDYEFEIRADSDEIDKLQELFEDTADAEIDNVQASVNMFDSSRFGNANRYYDDYLTDIYKMLYQLGTPETRKHIESMGLPLSGIPEKVPE